LALARAEQDRGAGMLGSRTENSEVYSTGTASLQWWIGRDGIDTPDNYSMKPSLVSALLNIVNGLNDMADIFQTTLAMLQGEGTAILNEFKVELPIEDISALTQAITQFQNFSQTVQGHIDFFNQYSDPSSEADRATINARLETVKSYAETIVNGVNNRCNGIPALLGNASQGVNKHLARWVAELVKKPDGPYAMILGSQTMQEMAETSLQKKDDELNFFELDKNLWMEPTFIQAVYDRAVLDMDKTIKRIETDIMWNLIQSANKYKVLAKPFSEIPQPLSNAEWDESSGVWITNKLESGFLNNMRTITPPTETTVFRIVSFDTDDGDSGDFQRIDAFNTKSKQTDIVSGVLPFTQKPDMVGPDGVKRSVVSFDEETAKQIRERDFMWLNESLIAQIIEISDLDYMLDTMYGTVTGLRKLTGLYYVDSASDEPGE
jgi:hypothetical protein